VAGDDRRRAKGARGAKGMVNGRPRKTQRRADKGWSDYWGSTTLCQPTYQTVLPLMSALAVEGMMILIRDDRGC